MIHPIIHSIFGVSYVALLRGLRLEEFHPDFNPGMTSINSLVHDVAVLLMYLCADRYGTKNERISDVAITRITILG
jgi:hypothetical protein